MRASGPRARVLPPAREARRAVAQPHPLRGWVLFAASGLPAGLLALPLFSESGTFVPNPGGGQGNLCVGGSVGRFIDQIQNSGAAGEIAITVDLTQIPGPNGPVTGMVGDSWNFQCWFRDANPTSTSNFTDAIEVVLE